MGSEIWKSRKQVADYWGVSVTTVDRMILRDELGVMRIGRSVRIPISEIVRFESERSVANHEC